MRRRSPTSPAWSPPTKLGRRPSRRTVAQAGAAILEQHLGVAHEQHGVVRQASRTTSLSDRAESPANTRGADELRRPTRAHVGANATAWSCPTATGPATTVGRRRRRRPVRNRTWSSNARVARRARAGGAALRRRAALETAGLEWVSRAPAHHALGDHPGRAGAAPRGSAARGPSGTAGSARARPLGQLAEQGALSDRIVGEHAEQEADLAWRRRLARRACEARTGRARAPRRRSELIARSLRPTGAGAARRQAPDPRPRLGRDRRLVRASSRPSRGSGGGVELNRIAPGSR